MSISNSPGGANVPPFDAVADIRKFAIVRDEFLLVDYYRYCW